jgi:hypothetical protein
MRIFLDLVFLGSFRFYVSSRYAPVFEVPSASIC